MISEINSGLYCPSSVDHSIWAINILTMPEIMKKVKTSVIAYNKNIRISILGYQITQKC